MANGLLGIASAFQASGKTFVTDTFDVEHTTRYVATHQLFAQGQQTFEDTFATFRLFDGYPSQRESVSDATLTRQNHLLPSHVDFDWSPFEPAVERLVCLQVFGNRVRNDLSILSGFRYYTLLHG